MSQGLKKIMSLERIHIQRRLVFGDREPGYAASVTFDGEDGSVTLKLTPQEGNALVLAVADALLMVGNEAAQRLRDSVVASVKTIEATANGTLP